MKTLQEKINETLNVELGYVNAINEAWAERKNYAQMLKEIFDAYDKKKNAKPKKYRFGPGPGHKAPEELLAKYPMQILIDKAGYEPKEITRTMWGPKGRSEKKEFSKEHYGMFIAELIQDGKLNKDDMINWWKEYDEEVAKKNWHDPKFIFKQLDVTRLWNPYYPKDDSCLQALINEPARIARYVMPYRFSAEEKEDFKAFLADPANQEDLKVALKGIKNSIMKARPSFTTGTVNMVKTVIDNAEYSGGDIKELMEKEYKSSHKSYYQGANEKDCEASAIIGLILKALNEMYGFEVWSSITKKEDENRWAEYENEVSVRGEVSDETLSGFLDDADYLKFKIKNIGRSKKEDKGTVHNSSFTNNYNYDIDVICYKCKNFKDEEPEEVYHKTFTDITLGSYFYSGGW